MWIMSNHVLVGLFGPTQAAEDSTPPKDAAGRTKTKAPKLGFLRLLKLVFVAVVIAGVGIGVWFLQPIPMVTAMFHSVASQTSIPAVFNPTGSSPPDQTQAEVPPSAAAASASATPSAEASPNAIPDVHPTTLVKVPTARRQARSSSLSAGEPASALPDGQVVAAADGSGVTASAATGQAAAPPERVPIASPAAERRAAPLPQSPIAPAAARTPLYSSADADVAPPKPIIQQKLGGIVGAIEPGAEVTIEFVVNEQGEVEFAKAKGVPRSVGESLLMATGLHAIKSWRFDPAQRNGQPVRYRNSISFGAY
jgi:periplasmic protein TonB